ncbi:ribbon-helix-helix protein, CopG family [Geomonas sp. RF6]|uniref:CopG family ribbon-helix-helix protein n=1 Tax=Geomonas sp. RF6 TaxID=2897342 RepID=UPI001E55191F|nr:ribbon-helix-helix protein, CopG family [Geomonas sp. RF6]UFS69547.1 ribbon-helix-helix protein, CopG family [Geomonas sp. RF6]
MRSASINLKIEPSINDRLEQMARSTKRSKSALVEAAIQQYLDQNEWQLREIEEGVKEIEDGRVMPHAELLKRWEAKGADQMAEGQARLH